MTARAAGGLAAALAGALVLAGCGSSGGTPRDRVLPLTVPAHVSVTTRDVGQLGRVLVDGRGRTLYMFPPDAGSKVTCTGPCAGTWPPLVVQDGHGVSAGGGVIAADLGTLADPNTGARVVTYAGYPLYRYAGDVKAGTADGQALFLNGGPWYAIRPSGQPVTVDPAARR